MVFGLMVAKRYLSSAPHGIADRGTSARKKPAVFADVKYTRCLLAGLRENIARNGAAVTLMPNSRFALVIFDCDGVLVDSEPITNRVFTKMLNELGVEVSREEAFEKFVGRSLAQCLEMIAGLLGREVPADFVRQYHQRSATALKAELKAVPGVEAALDAIQLPYCVASNGSREKMQTTLGITGLLPKFEDKLFSVSEVARGKPFPDVFLYAAGKSGVAPSDCVVIEDTPTGVSAGVAAGMTVYGYCAHTPAHRLIAAGAHGTFGRMSDLPELLLDAAAHRGMR
jgi:HAD superfamily hydrolase (TIGR01509 family)